MFECFPRFDIGGVELREIKSESDGPAYYAYMNRPEVKEFITHDNVPVDLAAAVDDLNYWGGLFKRRSSIYWAIALSETGQMIGTIGFNAWNRTHNRSEISYDLDPICWGHGIMHRAMERILEFAHVEMKMMRVQATVVTENSRSIKLLERMNFEKEGVLRKYEIVAGQHRDYYMYSKVW
ncbi:MAG: GNAT family N-acetyltransferase [Rickettsiaceae bacterium]|nr:GNAT family N-acetyltransferase [Rickettsiaceae bacterium]